MRRRFTKDFNGTVFRYQADIFLRGYRLHIRTVVADVDIAFLGRDIDAAFLSRYGLHNLYITLARLDGHISSLGKNIATVPRFRVAYNDIPLTAGNRNILGRCKIFANLNIAIIHFKGKGTLRIYIPAEGDIAFVIHLGINIAFCFGTIRNFNIAIVSLQLQVAGCLWIVRRAGRIQFPVKVNQQVFRIVLIPRQYRNIAHVRLRFAKHFNDAVLCGKRYILFCMDRKICRAISVVADMNLTFSGSNINAAVRRSNRLVDGHIACPGGNRYVAAAFYIAGRSAAHGYMARIGG